MINPNHQFGRKDFIIKLLGASSVLVGCRPTDSPELTIKYPDRLAIQQIGEAVSHIDKRTPDAITREIQSLAKLTEEDLDLQIVKDFKEEEVMEVEGWILSKTEATVCLFYFQRSSIE